MNLLNLNIVVNIVLHFLLPETLAAGDGKHRYIVMHPNTYDDLPGVDPDHDLFSKVLVTGFSKHTVLMSTKKSRFVSIDLTEAQAQKLKQKLDGTNGLVAQDNLISIPNIPHRVIDPNSTSADSEFLTNEPPCKAIVDNVDFLVLDTQVFPTAPDLQGVQVIIGPNFTPDPSPCHPHGTWVSSVIAGSRFGVIPNGSRSIVNVVVFNCMAQGFPSYIIRAFDFAMQFAKNNAILGRRTLINLSGGGGYNPAMNAAADALIDAGIPIFVSAGNDAIEACTGESPASASKVFAVGATTPPGNIPAYFTNWGKYGGCVRFYLPGVDILVGDVSNPSITMGVSGTSFASPIGAALGGIELGRDLHATPINVVDRLTSRMITVTPPPGGSFNNLMPVLLTTNACANNLLIFPAFVTTKANSNKFLSWNNAVNKANLCVSFQASSKTNSILLGLRQNSTNPNDVVSIKIGVKVNKQFVHSISQCGKVIAIKRTSTRTLNNKLGKVFKVTAVGKSVLFSYHTIQGTEVSFLAANVTQPSNFKEISFSGSEPGVKYINAMKC